MANPDNVFDRHPEVDESSATLVDAFVYKLEADINELLPKLNDDGKRLFEAVMLDGAIKNSAVSSVSEAHGEMENMLFNYYIEQARKSRTVCQHCFNNLGPALQKKIRKALPPSTQFIAGGEHTVQ